MNSRIVEKILSRQSTPQTVFKTRTSDWHELEAINSPPVTFARLALANLYYGPFGDLLEGPFPTDVRGYTVLVITVNMDSFFEARPRRCRWCRIWHWGDTEATCARNRTDAGSGIGGDTGDDGSVVVGARSRTDAGSGFGGDARDGESAVMRAENKTGDGSGPRGDVGDDRSAVVSARNRTGAGSALKGDVGDDRSLVVDDGLAAGDDGSPADDDGLAVRIDKRIDVDDELGARAGNQLDSNRPDADLILTTMGDIRADLIKDFNNSVLPVVSVESSCIVLDKYVIDSPARILANVINNPFGDLSSLSMALPSSPLLPSLPAPGNSDNIPTTFIYYMLICMQDLVPSRWPYLPLPSFLFCLLQPLAIPVIFSQFSLTIYLFVCRIF